MNAEVVSSHPQSRETATVGARVTYRNPVATALGYLASLKLTVGLLIVAVAVTFIGTLEQTRADIHTVKSKYFLENRMLVPVPLKVFMVPAWSPERFHNISGTFYVPSGMAILILMILNMSAAHLIRFRLQASGLRLAIGLFVAALAGLFTWAIIFNAPRPGIAPGAPPIPWFQMWVSMLLVILGIACAAAFGYFTLPKDRKYERMFMAFTAVLAAGTLLLTIISPNKGFIGDSAMRVLWQLAQSTMAAGIGLVACLLLFRRKGGIVLLHLGVLGLMANELYVNSTNVEQRIELHEGETSNKAVDIRSVELAIVDLSDPQFDRITTIPYRKLNPKGSSVFNLSGSSEASSIISAADLPFDVKVVRFLENSSIDVVKNRAENLATQGSGLAAEATPRPEVSGVESNGRNISSAYIELIEKDTGKSLGTHLVSQYFEIPQISRALNVPGRDIIQHNGKQYLLDLRFKTEYKPYQVELKNVTAEYYIGTSTPKYFSSDIVFKDGRNDLRFEKHIWMNNPMRYDGETFYQTNYHMEEGGHEVSTIQIVRNRGWMIPYVCCMFTVLGLFLQFGSSLLAFLEKRAKSAEASTPGKLVPRGELVTKNEPNPTPELKSQSTMRSIWNWLPAALIVGAFAIYVGGQAFQAFRETVKKDELRLDLLGQLPVTKSGRVQPLDSVARHSVLQMNKRELVNNQLESRQPAIRWLADTMFGAEGHDQYRLFRIEDSSVLDALGLPFPMPTKERHQKSTLKYTLEELLKARPKFKELLTGDPDQYTPFQLQLDRIAALVSQATALEMTFGYPRDVNLFFLERLEIAEQNANSRLIPLLVPTNDRARPWISFAALDDQLWLKQLAEQHAVETTTDLAKALVTAELVPFQREELIKARVIDKIVSNDELYAMLSEQFGKVSKDELTKLLRTRWNQIPAEKTQSLRDIEGPFVDAVIAEQVPRFERILEQQLSKIMGKSGRIETNHLPLADSLRKLRSAYLEGDARTFNETLANYLSVVRTQPPQGLQLSFSALASEYWYNRFAPFYLAMIIYAAVTVLGMLSWVGFSEPLNRAAGWLLWLGFSVHVLGMVLRILISGRPPVTNLYSSFLFTALIAVFGLGLLERFTRIRINYFLGGVIGFFCLLTAWNMTLSDGDTFAVLVAVLDTQFWLATHVVTISIGYGATVMAGFFGLTYVIKGLFTTSLKKQPRRSLADVIYGTVCFGLISSFFGTVLGGLWGDDSWGRFWGWDPKENGALMIVLWNAVILHARWGGMVRERGMALLAILGNVITLWSWKGVNALGVGLHAYAGTEDKSLLYMIAFGGLCLLTALIGLIPTRHWASYQAEPAKSVSSKGC
jgi:ABC-type transport system involved in cytochrome c biogenesis permease subunit